MTFPPCISSSFSSRSIGDIAASSSNFSRINPLRHQPQQSRLFCRPTVLRPGEQNSPMDTLKLRSATPDSLSAVKNERKPEEDLILQDSDEERAMEDNAARMLLQLSKIVSNEISADSGCITRECSQYMGRKNEESHVAAELLQDSKHVYASDRDFTKIGSSSLSPSVPKSIEIHKRDWEDSFNAPTINSLPNNNGIPHLVIASNQDSISNPSARVSPTTLFKNVSFESIGSKNGNNRFRTVSLASDDMIPEDRELSPLLVPISLPLTFKDVKSHSFTFQESPQQIPRHVSRLGQSSFLLDKTEVEQEALRRVLAGGGPEAKSLSYALAASNATVITPVPEHSRPVLSFSNLNYNKNSTTSKTITGIGSVMKDIGEDRKGHFPMDLPPLLMNPKKTTSIPTVGVAASLVEHSKRVMPLATKSLASTRKSNGRKNQPVHGPRGKKKATPKKQQRQRHTGKKFSWKAYPELEEFLIENREEYLSYSAKNYTIEQRDYNNRLTSRLLEHADASGYPTLFENCAFSAVRDRIRSYYKSYVQSFKRRKERQQQQERLKTLEMNYI